MQDLLDDVKSTEHNERLYTFVRKILIIMSIVGGIALITSSIVTWQRSRAQNIIFDESTLFISVINQINSSKIDDSPYIHLEKDAIDTLEKLLLQNGSMYSALAGLYLANYAISNNDYSKALFYYDKIAGSKCSQDIKDYAKLMTFHIKLNRTSIPLSNILKELDSSFPQCGLPSTKIEALYPHCYGTFGVDFLLLKAELLESAGETAAANSLLEKISSSPEVSKNFADLAETILRYRSWKTSASKAPSK